MNALISWTITALMVALVAAFALYLVAVRRLPVDRRPKVRTFDRFGRLLGDYENPGGDIAPGRSGDPLQRRMPKKRRAG